jgi:hypothetical protein
MMKLQRSTWTLLGIAVLLGGFVLVTELQRLQPDEVESVATDQSGTDLFAFEEEDIQAFTVETGDRTLSFRQDEAGTWQMIEPEAQAASDPTVAFLLNQLAIAKAQSPTDVTAEQLSEFGLADPLATVTVTLDTGNEHTLILGDTNFSGDSRYAIADPPADPAADDLATDATDTTAVTTVVLVPNAIASAVDRPLEEWEALDIPVAGESPTDETDTETNPSETRSETEDTGSEAESADAADTDPANPDASDSDDFEADPSRD